MLFLHGKKTVYKMANKRNLKKDVEFLINEVIGDCYTYMLLNGDKNREQVIGIVESVVDKRNELFHRINNPDPSADRKKVRAYYKGIYNDLLACVDESFTQLSGLSKGK